MTALGDLVRPDEYPLSSRYDPAWLVSLDMGPHPLWLLEDLSRDLELTPGTRVLDLGSGMGATSVFLAREFDLEVCATDLWVSTADVAAVLAEAGLRNRVHAVRADARALPFAHEVFDAIVSIDAFEYFGTADDYLASITRFLKPGGQLAIATPALTREVDELGALPRHIDACVGREALEWHTAEWWRRHWEDTGLVTVTSARLQTNGWHDWLLWTRACRDHGVSDPGMMDAIIAMLEADAAQLLTFALVVARKTAPRS